MFITKKHISRRTVLRGAGVSLALPLLDSMIPAQTRVAPTPARLACLEMVHGAAGSTVEGGNKHYWSPAKVGRDFEITQTLASLEPYKDYLTVISHTDLDPAGSLTPVEEGRRSLPVHRCISDSGACADDGRFRYFCRDVDRSNLCCAVWAGHDADFHAVEHRGD